MNLRNCFEEGLLRKVSMPPDVVDKELENAQRHIDNAQFCIRGKKYDLAVVSVYTSMFHAARSILFRDGIKERSHVCVILYLKDKYPELSDNIKTLDNYRRSRHVMLYGIDINVLGDDARKGVEEASKFLELVKLTIKQRSIK